MYIIEKCRSSRPRCGRRPRLAERKLAQDWLSTLLRGRAPPDSHTPSRAQGTPSPSWHCPANPPLQPHDWAMRKPSRRRSRIEASLRIGVVRLVSQPICISLIQRGMREGWVGYAESKSVWSFRLQTDGAEVSVQPQSIQPRC